MRKRLLIFLAFSVSAHASEEFGGVFFDSSVEQEQVSSLKSDLVYLYKTPQKSIDQDLLSLAGLKNGQGPELHNWLINRMKYVVGENFDLKAHTMVLRKPVKFPDTPFPTPKVKPKPPYANFKSPNKVNSVVVMSNPSGGYYTQGKRMKRLLFTKLDGTRVVFSSPRAGLVQVGQGLFKNREKLGSNLKSPGSTIYRLATLMHEGRHTDGNGTGLAFRHDYCPMGHPFEYVNACETAGNGPYSVGTLLKRQLLRNCTNCSAAEKTFLQSSIADGFARLLRKDGGSTVTELESQISKHKVILAVFQRHLKLARTADEKIKITKEITGLTGLIADKQNQHALLVSKPKRSELLDPTPEGYFKSIDIKDSQLIMLRSMK